MSQHVLHYLLVFDRHAGRRILTREFGEDAHAAVEAYQALEAVHRDEPWMDIVLIGSDSLDTVRVTHKNYFDEAQTMAEIQSHLARAATSPVR